MIQTLIGSYPLSIGAKISDVDPDPVGSDPDSSESVDPQVYNEGKSRIHSNLYFSSLPKKVAYLKVLGADLKIQFRDFFYLDPFSLIFGDPDTINPDPHH